MWPAPPLESCPLPFLKAKLFRALAAQRATRWSSLTLAPAHAGGRPMVSLPADARGLTERPRRCSSRCGTCPSAASRVSHESGSAEPAALFMLCAGQLCSCGRRALCHVITPGVVGTRYKIIACQHGFQMPSLQAFYGAFERAFREWHCSPSREAAPRCQRQ